MYSSSGGFLFVPVDGPAGRHNKANKPASQRYNKEARTHVMRDIGFARRKPKENRAKVASNASQRLHAVDGPKEAMPKEEGATKQKLDQTVLFHTVSEESVPRLDPVTGSATKDERDYALPIVSKHIGGYRQDPFIRYPVEMNSSARFLLDACE